MNYTKEERLDQLLDKILSFGIDSLSEMELDFLDAHSNGSEEEINNLLNDIENSITFYSSDGLFTFKLEEIYQLDTSIELIGTITVPDMKGGKSVVRGNLWGKIIVWSKNQFSVDFSDGKMDIFDFCEVIEYELDIFIEEIIQELIF